MRSTAFTFAASISSALALTKGFNYGSTDAAGTVYLEADYTSLFTNAANLVGTSDFTSARLYTMIQGDTTDTLTEAVAAAVSTDTELLLGMWASSGAADFADEITALKSAISTYPDLYSKIAGISVGSEDLYRITAAAAEAGSVDPGAEPATLITYIAEAKAAIAGTTWADVVIGHVDTWTAWANASNDGVAEVCDFIGVDAYPYFQTDDDNTVENGAELFTTALASLTSVAAAKDVWITETGWPVTGATENDGVPSTTNAKYYWDTVGCDIAFVTYNTWWYTFDDSGADPSFGVSTGGTTPLYDLTCNTTSTTTSSSSSASATSSATATSASTASGVVASSSEEATSAATSAAATGTGVAASTSAVGTASSGVTATASSNGTVSSATATATTYSGAAPVATAGGLAAAVLLAGAAFIF